MSDTQAQEAARLAEWLEADACDLQTPREAAALLRSQAARIAELERDGAELFGKVFSLGYELGKVEDERDALRAELARMREPLSDEQVQAIINTKHFDPKHVLRNSDLVCLSWYRLGLRDGEAAHGITKTGGGV